MRLSNPEQAMSLSNSTHDSKEEKEDFPPGGGEWVPLPAFIMKADFFDKLVSAPHFIVLDVD